MLLHCFLFFVSVLLRFGLLPGLLPPLISTSPYCWVNSLLFPALITSSSSLVWCPSPASPPPGHEFHLQCIYGWLEQQRTRKCPVCSRTLELDF